MASIKYRLGELIRLEDERNVLNKYSIKDVKGLSIQKEFIDTKANMEGVSLTPYILVKPDSFAFVTVTSRNGEKITIAHNTTPDTYIVSSSYVVFRISKPELLNSTYLFMFFNRPEFDRYSRYNSYGSARETFNWEDMCNVEIELPGLSTQKKYVDIYKTMLANQKNYERGLEDLKVSCEIYVSNLKHQVPNEKIGPYLEVSENRNNNNLGIEFVRGLATSKQLIPTKANLDGVSLSNYKTISPGQLAYVSDTSRRGDKISLGYNDSDVTYLVSSISTVFGTKRDKLIPEYLMLFLIRPEFDRYARFHSWGSARETFDWDEMCDVKIPIPDIKTQRAISDIYSVYIERKKINERLKSQIKDICPILIKGSIVEARKEA